MRKFRTETYAQPFFEKQKWNIAAESGNEMELERTSGLETRVRRCGAVHVSSRSAVESILLNSRGPLKL